MPAADQGIAKSQERYHLVPRVLCFITLGDEVLLLKGAPTKKIWPGKYNGLGGHVERGESVHAAALREIREEAGVLVKDLRLRGVITIDTGEPAGIGLFVFTATALGRAVTPSIEGDLEWMPVYKLTSLDAVEDIPILLPRVLQMTAKRGDACFSARYTYNAEGRLIVAFDQDPRVVAPNDKRGRHIEAGDWVRLVEIPSDIRWMLRETRTVFRRALGQTFRVEAFDNYGHAELDLSRKVAGHHTIWVEPEHLLLFRRRRKHSGLRHNRPGSKR